MCNIYSITLLFVLTPMWIGAATYIPVFVPTKDGRFFTPIPHPHMLCHQVLWHTISFDIRFQLFSKRLHTIETRNILFIRIITFTNWKNSHFRFFYVLHHQVLWCIFHLWVKQKLQHNHHSIHRYSIIYVLSSSYSSRLVQRCCTYMVKSTPSVNKPGVWHLIAGSAIVVNKYLLTIEWWLKGFSCYTGCTLSSLGIYIYP